MMKKITFLFALMTFTFGFAQEFPLTFEEPEDDNWVAFNGSAVSVIDDGGDMVLQIVGGTMDFDGAFLNLSVAVDLSDDSNNTITFQMNPTDVGNDTRTHLLKFENGVGGPAVSEVFFDTVGSGWQDVTVDFPDGLGSFPTIVLFTDAGSGNSATGTYLFDDIDGGTNVPPSCDDGVMNGDETGVDCGGPSCSACPDLPSPAPQPTTPDSDVYSINSDTGGYTNGFDYEGGCFGELDGEIDLDTTAESNNALRFDFSKAGWGCTNSATVDVSTIGGNPIAFASFQYYTEDATDFYFDLISGPAGSTVESFYYIGQSSAGGAPAADEALVQGSWQHVVIPITEFTSQTFDPTELFQFKFDVFAGATPGIVYIDNILLSSSSPTLGIKELRLDGVSIFPNPTRNNWIVKATANQISSVKVFDILGKSIMTLEPESNEFSIDGSALSKGIYLARIESSNGNKTVKLVKE